MSDDHLFRPRRAMPEGEHVDPAPGEDTPADRAVIGQRAAVDAPTEDAETPPAPPDAMQPDAGQPDPEQPPEQPDPGQPDPGEADPVHPDPVRTGPMGPGPLVPTPIPPEHAAFMRPGTVPDHVLEAAVQDIAPVVSPALSEAATGAAAPDPAAAGASDEAPSVSVATTEVSSDASPADQNQDEISAGPARPQPRLSGVTKLAAVLLVPVLMVAAFLGVRALTERGDVVVRQTASASSPAPTPTQAPPLTTASLVTSADAAAALGNSGWAEARTWETVDAGDPGVTCMSNVPTQPTPTVTRQRGLTSKTERQTAVLQRMDAFATAEVAHQAYTQRLAAMSACDDVPALISSAASVTGLADESFSMTIAFEDPRTVFHTVVLTRTGQTVTMTDVANAGQAVPAQKAAAAARGPLSRLCAASKGTCPTTPETRAVSIPPTPIFGWLAQSDLPRITKGQGMWSPTQPINVASKGTQCENMTLATVTGPTGRNQRSYILTQDDAAPEGFGVDQVLFTFANEQGAQVFADKLVRNLNSCGSRTETAEVSAAQNLSITGANGTRVTGRVWKVSQAISAKSTVLYRVGVVRAGNRVAYVVTNPTSSFDFTDQAWLLVTARAGQRATQAA